MKLNINNLKKKTEGFTIIEVLIVLAIAGLILLVVFLAVPALQRNQRNNGRQSEAARLSSAVGNFVGNNQGTLPATAADTTSIIADFGTFKYLTPMSTTGVLGSAIVAGQVTLVPGAITTFTAVTADAVVIDTGAVCGTPSTAGMKTTTGTGRQVALIYTLESPGANYNQVCIQAE